MCYAWLTVPVHIFLPQVFIQMHCHIINSFLRKLHLCKKKKKGNELGVILLALFS